MSYGRSWKLQEEGETMKSYIVVRESDGMKGTVMWTDDREEAIRYASTSDSLTAFEVDDLSIEVYLSYEGVRKSWYGDIPDSWEAIG